MSRTRTPTSLLILAYLAFISLGLPDALLGVAWPSIRDTFRLHDAFLGLPLALAAGAYFLSGLFAGRWMQALGIGVLLAGSTLLVTAGVFGYAAAPAFFWFVAISPLVGLGSGAIDTALNAFAARRLGARHMSWLHAAYAAGAMAGPAVMTAAFSTGASWRVGYVIVGGMLAALVPAFFVARKRWEAPVEVEAPGPPSSAPRLGARAALRDGRVWLQIGIFFVYSGVEICAGQWSFTVLTEGRGVDPIAAGTWVAVFWGGLLAGRVVLGAVVERIGPEALLRIATVAAAASAVLFVLGGPAGGAWALPLLSFSLAAIYPGLMSETPRRVGEALAPHAVGFQVSAATLGLAVLPSFAGGLSERFGLRVIPWVIAGCALVLLVLHEWLYRLTRLPPAAQRS